MSISATSNTYVPAYPPLSPSRVSAPPGNPPLPAGIDRVKHATEMARGYAGTAELDTQQINRGIATYNHFSADNLKNIIEEIKGNKRRLEDRQRVDGDGWEQKLRDHAVKMQDFAKRAIETTDQGLRAHLNVSGSTYTYDPKTDAYARGAFTASVDLGDSAVRFDSRTGPEVSIMGAAFTANFTRNSIPQMGTLDYEVLNPDELEAIRSRDALLLDGERMRSMRIRRLDLNV